MLVVLEVRIAFVTLIILIIIIYFFDGSGNDSTVS